MNLYEHTIIARQDTSPSELKHLTEKYSNCLLRLPLFYDLKLKSIDLIVNIINKELNK